MTEILKLSLLALLIANAIVISGGGAKASTRGGHGMGRFTRGGQQFRGRIGVSPPAGSPGAWGSTHRSMGSSTSAGGYLAGHGIQNYGWTSHYSQATAKSRTVPNRISMQRQSQFH